MSYSDKPFWPRATNHETEVGLSDNPKRIDLGKPDAAAAELAEALQTATTNTLFTRIVLMRKHPLNTVLNRTVASGE